MKILIIQNKMIGDVLTSSILFETLRKTYPCIYLLSDFFKYRPLLEFAQDS